MPRFPRPFALIMPIVTVWPTPNVTWGAYQDWDGYYRSLKRGFRHSLRRTRRRLTEQGKLTFEPINDSVQFRVILDWIFHRKAEWLARTNQQSVWRETDVYRNFLIAVAHTQMTGQIQSFILKLNDEILSAVLCRISKLRVEAVIIASNPAYSKYGPGQLIHEDILKWTFGRRLDCDLRIGNQPHKQSWANSMSEAISYEFVNSLRGAAFVAVRTAYQATRQYYFRREAGEKPQDIRE